MKAVITGAGVGGLTTALALRRVGVEAIVLERARDLRELGTGLGLGVWRNAMLGLRHLGLADAVAAIGTPIEREQFWTWRGEVLADWTDAQLERKLGKLEAPAIGAMRADLYPLLAGALDEGSVQLDSRCVGLEQDRSGVTAQLADGREVRGDVLIGADGAQSTVRTLIAGGIREQYAGYAAWQAVVDIDTDEIPLGTTRHVFGRGESFSFFPVGPGRVYWFTYANDPQSRTPPQDGWKAVLQERFAGWPQPTEELVAAADTHAIRRVEVMNRDLPSRQGEGRVTLLGDAAHPMQPNLGQGACQAIEDAVILGGCLASADDPVAALREYEARRQARTVRYYRTSRRIGRLRTFENAVVCLVTEWVLKRIMQRAVLNRHRDDLAFTP